ncbi:MAG: hypothetical protein R3250_03325 [Melioribacteraceae bacterium]|nr:hypothetical protein [Melioribacteraceae bacterium]
MKFTGKTIRLNKNGKIKLPKSILKLMDIHKESSIEMMPIPNGLLIQRKMNTCLVTGEKSEEVVEILPGLFLSPKGIELLKKELELKGFF